MVIGGGISFGIAWDDNGNIALVFTGGAGVGVEAKIDTPVTPSYTCTQGVNIDEYRGMGNFKVDGDIRLNGTEATVGVIVGLIFDLESKELIGFNSGYVGGGVDFLSGSLYIILRHGFRDLDSDTKEMVIGIIENADTIPDDIKQQILEDMSTGEESE